MKQLTEFSSFVVLSIACAFVLLPPCQSFCQALSAHEQALVYYETQANSAYGGKQVRPSLSHPQSYLLVPENLTTVFSAQDKLAQASLKVLTSTIDGRKFVKWIINPDELLHRRQIPWSGAAEDLTSYEVVQKWLREKGLDSSIHEDKSIHEFWSASRSVFLKGDIFFGLKTSTVSIDGNIQNPLNRKTHHLPTAREEFALHQYLERIKSRFATYAPIYVLQKEPLSIGLPELQLAMSVRNVEPENPSHILVPGFVLMHETEGLKLAAKQGTSPQEFILRVLRQVGKAAAQLYMTTGLYSDSLHQQNWMMELDEKGIFTGRIYFRDVGDGNVATAFPREMNDIYGDSLPPGNEYNDHGDPRFYGLGTHKTGVPSWIQALPGGDHYYSEAALEFWTSYRHELRDWASRVTGGKAVLTGRFDSSSQMPDIDYPILNGGSWSVTRTEGWKTYFEFARHLKVSLRCEEVLFAQ